MQLDDRLLGSIQPDLRRIAAARLAGEQNCSLAASDLVNEAMVRILSQDSLQVESRARVLGWVSHVMRQVLIDHARRKQADKRAHQRVTLITNIPDQAPIDLIELELVLEELAGIDPARVELVEMRFYGGMTIDEIADATGSSPATVKRRWAATRTWLYHRMMAGRA